MNKLTTLLVGVHFHPPSKTILANVPAGLQVILRANPENPYDQDAILVELEGEALAELLATRPDLGTRLEVALPDQGVTLEQLLSTGPIVLGHVAASNGKPLAKGQTEVGMPRLSGTMEWKEPQAAESYQARLDFAPSGTALVVVEWEEEAS